MDHDPTNLTLRGIYYALRNQSNIQADGTGIGDDRFAFDNRNLVLIVRSFDWKLLL